MMKKKVLAFMLTTVVLFTTTIPALATPDNSTLSESRAQYAEIENKIAEIQNKIYDVEAEIEPLQVKVEDNKIEIENINTVIENTEKDIDVCKAEISELDAVLGERVNGMYKSGNLEFSYLTYLLEAESTANFFSRIQVVSKVIGKDKDAIDDVMGKRDELNSKVESLEEKKEEILTLQEEIETSLKELDVKKKEQEVFINEAEKEREKFDSEYLADLEREVVQTQYNVINSSSSTSTQINNAITQLKSVRDSQLKSEIVKAEVNAMIEKGQTAYNKKKQSEAASSITANRGELTGNATGTAAEIINEAYKHVGKWYVYGATGPDTFDCSGFTQYVYRVAAGVNITRTTFTQINVGTPVSQSQLQPGDLVFPHSGHVGIYIGDGKMIHAPQTGKQIQVAPVYAFWAARRIL